MEWRFACCQKNCVSVLFDSWKPLSRYSILIVETYNQHLNVQFKENQFSLFKNLAKVDIFNWNCAKSFLGNIKEKLMTHMNKNAFAEFLNFFQILLSELTSRFPCTYSSCFYFQKCYHIFMYVGACE